jgi:hypothetical protein
MLFFMFIYRGKETPSPVSILTAIMPEPRPVELQHCLTPDDISKKYREAITHYSKVNYNKSHCN